MSTDGSAGTTAADVGRAGLAAWRAAQPDNWFTADVALQRHLRRHWGDAAYAARAPELIEQGRMLATIVEPMVVQMERHWNLPREDRWDGIGRRTEGVAYDGRYHEVGRHLYGVGTISRLAEPGNVLHSASLGYLCNQLGEAGHNCPIVCTAGIVRALQDAASDELKARFLPGLLSREYDVKLDGAQFMTEVQGGSDVGLNGVTATPTDQPGAWRINGEKWFCSNATASLILLTARPDGAAPGTGGLGLFLVPRTLDDGSVNTFYLRRLKEKLGTRAMASGEIDFVDTLAWNVGPVDCGFKTMMTNVINTSRLYNASGTLGMARRAQTIGWTFAGHREAFGGPIRRYPLVQETLADNGAELAVLLAGHLDLCHRRDALDLGQAGPADAGFFRVALNLNKYRTSVSASEVVRGAIELLGGNGAIESFSALPRLLRDCVVYENWEGTHNTLAMQVLRDMSRLGVGEHFVGTLHGRFAALAGGPLGQVAERGRRAVDALAGQLTELAQVDPALASLRMRPLSDRMSWLMAAAAFAEHTAWEIETLDDTSGLAVLEHFWARRLERRPSLPSSAYLASLAPLVEGPLASIR